MSLKIGALFDWDGVIGDSAECHERSWVKLADSRNLFLPKDAFKITFGRRNVEIITEVLKWTDDLNEAQELSDAKEIIYRRLCETEGLPTIAGAVEFIKELKSANIPCVVGSSAPRANLEVAIKVLGLEDYFAAVVASYLNENTGSVAFTFSSSRSTTRATVLSSNSALVSTGSSGAYIAAISELESKVY